MKLFRFTWPTVLPGTPIDQVPAKKGARVAFISPLPGWDRPMIRLKSLWLRNMLYRAGYDLYVIKRAPKPAQSNQTSTAS